MRNRLHEIAKLDQPPWRSSDCANCILDQPNDGKQNYLYLQKVLRSSYLVNINYSKNIVITEKQIHTLKFLKMNLVNDWLQHRLLQKHMVLLKNIN